MTAIKFTFRQNPVYRAEYHYQQYAIENGRSGRIWIVLAMLLMIPTLLAALAYTLVILVNPVWPIAADVVQWGDGIGFILLVVMNVALYAVVTLVNLALAANSIRREKAGHTWDNLLLTDLETAQIVNGKWWASMSALGGDQVMVGIIRIGLIALLFISMEFPYQQMLGLPIEWTHFPLLILITVIYTALDAGLTAALGIMGTAGVVWPGAMTAIGFALRVAFSLAGFGYLLLTLVSLGHTAYGYLLMSLAGFAIYAFLIWAVLWAARKLTDYRPA